MERSGIGAVRCSQNDTDEIGKKRMKEEEYERMTWRKDRETGETEKGKRKKIDCRRRRRKELRRRIKKEQAKVDAAGRGIKFLAALAMPDDLKNRMN